MVLHSSSDESGDHVSGQNNRDCLSYNNSDTYENRRIDSVSSDNQRTI